MNREKRRGTDEEKIENRAKIGNKRVKLRENRDKASASRLIQWL